MAMARTKASEWRSLTPEAIREEVERSKIALWRLRDAKAKREVGCEDPTCWAETIAPCSALYVSLALKGRCACVGALACAKEHDAVWSDWILFWLQEYKPNDKWFHEVKIAQLLTVLREQEISEGISLRESRRKEK